MKAIGYLFGNFLALFFFGALYAQHPAVYSEYAYRKFTTQDGLPKMYTECVFQDSHGFIWIGTLHGVVRYDGFNFSTYEQLSKAEITSIRENDKKNILFFGFDAYYVFDYLTEKVEKKQYPAQLHFNELNSRLLPAGYAIFNRIIGDKENRVFCRIDDKGIEPVLENPILDAMVNENGMLFDEPKKLLYLPCKNDSTIKVISLKGKLVFTQKVVNPYSVFRHDNKIYCIAEDGVYLFDDKQFKLIINNYFPLSYSFIKTAVDIDGQLIISDLKTVFRFRENRLEKIFDDANLIIDICIDREGNLWLATYQGVFNLFRQQFRNYLLADKKDMFRVIVENPNGKDILAGTFDGKLYSITSLNSKTLTYPSNPNGYYFENYCGNVSGAAFLPASSRILKYKNNKASWLSLPVQEYRCVAEMPDGNLIGGWEKSFIIFSPNGKISKVLQDKELLQHCRSRPCFDKENNLYIGGNEGVTFISKGKSTLLTHPEIKSCWVTRSDNGKNIWIGSHNNLAKIENDTLLKFKELNGEITGIFFTKNDKMIVGTTQGIYIFDRGRKHFVIYNQLNGYTLSEPVRCDMYEDADGNVWMPSVGGIACFNPDKLLNAQPIPILQLLHFMSSTDNINWYREKLNGRFLKHDKNNIRFSYIGLSYSQAQNVRYQYRLRGFQDEWSNPVAEREVTFNNLKPGHYTFEIQCNAGTPETQTGVVSLPIYIKPAFWQTLFFKILAFALFAGIVAGFAIRYQRRKHEREIRKANREKEMNELRVQSVRLKSIPHFNSNVLAGIEYFIMTKSKEEANELLTTYSRFTNITLHGIDKAQRPLKDELDYVRMYLDLEKMRYGDKLSYEINVDENIDKSIMIPNMVLHTYAENAVKHGIRGKNAPGSVTISVKNENKGIRISVEDDGVGRGISAQKNKERNRIGHGLSILSRQIELYNQQNTEKIEEKVIDLTDEIGNPSGTRFELYIPYEYKYI